ncbi:hypothetical protein E2C01_023817 [Portunus trituberculatus]|uniref:Uncharacterized protein n=1 Tax=Portunus trituberculatus TaxID=210409 RepID=A0A5B7EB24_PORTR|nr:hypothetical protein [Portunus trituberculatus]
MHSSFSFMVHTSYRANLLKHCHVEKLLRVCLFITVPGFVGLAILAGQLREGTTRLCMPICASWRDSANLSSAILISSSVTWEPAEVHTRLIAALGKAAGEQT